ncbi:MAG: efflux RND transporter periplasmic adaptor subunit [Betaproteobacteria bacterium]|nr:efflux RND transporter periplasmic adaptor subunit [Betaproteobacteria bacterium]
MSPDPARPAVSHRKLQLIAVVMALLAVGVVVAGITTRQSEAAQLRERADAQAVVTVAVITPSRTGTSATLELPGRIEAFARAPIYARVSGYLKSWHVDIGGRVKNGQLLAEIETPDLDQQLLQAQAELASAKANAALATTTAKRWQALLANDAVSRQEAEEKTGDLTTKQSVVNALQANLDRFQALKRFTRIVAPFDGVVTARSTDVGALINVGGAPGSELFVVSDVRKLRVYVSLPQNYVSTVRQGSKARLTVPENPAKSHAATVQSLSQAINAASGSMLIQLAADNANGELLPGGFANVSFDLPRAAGALSIPPSALIFNKSGLRVSTVGADGKVQLKTVTVARDLGSVIEIATGLSADDRVIESPPDGIADGDAVRVASAEPKVNAAGKRERGKD